MVEKQAIPIRAQGNRRVAIPGIGGNAFRGIPEFYDAIFTA